MILGLENLMVLQKGLIHEDNKLFVPEKQEIFLSLSIGFLPSSMSRFYVLRRMAIESGNIIATNIYDITRNPIDSSTYLQAAFEESSNYFADKFKCMWSS